MDTETKDIPIGDILTITTGMLVSHDHMGGVYNILDWMTGESLFTHQLPRAMDACKPLLVLTFPEIASIEFPDNLGTNKDAIFDWVDRMGEKFGEYHKVPKLSEGEYERMGVMEELIQKMSPDAIIIPVVVE